MSKHVHASSPITKAYIDALDKQLRTNDATLIAHYYTHPDLQSLAEATGGFVSDS